MYKIDLPWSTLKPLFRYGNEAINLKCFTDLLTFGVFPNFKEVTESLAAYNAVRSNRGNLKQYFPLDDPNIVCVAVGDGATPRTGAVFAMRTAWSVYSVDPNLKNVTQWEAKIRRLKVIPKHIEDVKIPTASRVLVVAVHSHADLKASIAAVSATELIGVIAMPCCKPLELDDHPRTEYADKGIWSPENIIRTWLMWTDSDDTN